MVPYGRQPQKWTSTQVRALNGKVKLKKKFNPQHRFFFVRKTLKTFHEIRLAHKSDALHSFTETRQSFSSVSRNTEHSRQNPQMAKLERKVAAEMIDIVIWRCRYRASYCNLLITNEIHNSYDHFFIPQFFLSALHVSNESSRSSSGARHNILYYTVWYNRYNRAGESSC